jgi:hypothetical protein
VNSLLFSSLTTEFFFLQLHTLGSDTLGKLLIEDSVPTGHGEKDHASALTRGFKLILLLQLRISLLNDRSLLFLEDQLCVDMLLFRKLDFLLVVSVQDLTFLNLLLLQRLPRSPMHILQRQILAVIFYS